MVCMLSMELRCEPPADWYICQLRIPTSRLSETGKHLALGILHVSHSLIFQIQCC